MKNKKMRKMILTICTLVGALCMTGCGAIGCSTPKTETAPIHSVVLDGRGHANMAALNPQKAEEFIAEVCKSHGSVSMIAVDGAPYLIDSVDIPQGKAGLPDDKKEKIARQQASEILNVLQQHKAKTAEVDLLTALQMASQCLASLDGEKRILVMDSGVSTTNLLDMSKTMLEQTDTENLIKSLKKEKAIPKLKGIQVMWLGLGEVAEPQAKLQQKQRDNLQAIWEAVLSEAGVDEMTFYSDVAMTRTADETLPSVKQVQIPEPASVLQKTDCKIEEMAEKNISYKFGEESAAFRPDSAELLTGRKRVRRVFEPIIAYLKQNPKEKILLAGNTSSAGKQPSLVKLSKKRCQTIRQIMMEAGVNANQIETIGLGYFGSPFTQNDRRKDGSLNEEAAKKNRSVVVMSYKSETAKNLLEHSH